MDLLGEVSPKKPLQKLPMNTPHLEKKLLGELLYREDIHKEGVALQPLYW